MIDGILLGLGLYLGLGLIASIWLLTAGLVRTDPALDASPKRVRLILLPGCVALWPLLLRRSLHTPRGGQP